MAEYLQNPRRSQRAPVQCNTSVVSAHGAFEATTEDIGGHGCQLVSPRLVRKGEPVQLVVSHEAAREPLRVAGRVAWASDRQPWRLGIAYDESALGQSKRWFDELLARAPQLAAFRRVPDRIPVEAAVYLAIPPRFLVDFNADEVALLRSIGSGTSVAELRALLRDRWPQAQRALFSLLAHQHVTLSRGGSVHPDAWRKILSEVEASLAVESLRGSAAGPVAPAAPARSTPSAAPAPARPAVTSAPAAPARTAATSPAFPEVSLEPPPAVGGAPDAAHGTHDASDWLVSAADMMPPSWPAAVAPAPAAPVVAAPAAPGSSRAQAHGLDSGGSWVTPVPAAAAAAQGRGRPGEAHDLYESGLKELEAGKIPAAMALLRRALVLAPGDPEIAGALGRAMKGGR